PDPNSMMLFVAGNYKCREAWPHFSYKEAFTIFLDLGLLVSPLLIMILTYTSIAITLKKNIHQSTSSTATTITSGKCAKKRELRGWVRVKPHFALEFCLNWMFI